MIKIGFRLAVNFEDIWLIMIVQLMIEIFVCGVNVAASIKEKLDFNKTKKATIVSG